VRRREFIAGLGGAVAWPTAARAQQSAVPVIGILSESTAESVATTRLPAFMQGLKESGFVEGQSVAIEFRWANNEVDRLPDLAADLVRGRVSLIVTLTTNLPARAAKNATTTIPIVFFMGADPVQLGVVASLNRPGRNITGVSGLGIDLVQKRLHCFTTLSPRPTHSGFSSTPTIWAPARLPAIPKSSWQKMPCTSGPARFRWRILGQSGTSMLPLRALRRNESMRS
jgi:putative tryptophan/tyrosine transport system substrate-binding protein